MRRESGFSQWPAFFNVFQHLKTRVPQIICTEPTRFRHTQLLNNRSALQPYVQELIYQIDCLRGDSAVQIGCGKGLHVKSVSITGRTWSNN